ncbi:MAG: universal stress protein [Gemmatimonadota bacterium]|nr:MAG: universal stress protein [Gemmatimonadota bacterium]
MLTIKRILYPTDFSKCASHTLPHALYLASTYGAELHLLHALVMHEADPSNMAHRLPDMEELYRILEEHAETQMKAAVDEHGEAGFSIKSAQIRAISAAGAILDYAAENEIDLVVMGTHGRRGLRRLLLGSVAEEVVRLAPCPVLTVPERQDGPSSPGQVECITVPVDFSEHAKLALTYAVHLADTYGAHLHLLHVVDEVVYPDFYPPVMPSGGSITEELRDQSLERMKGLLAGIEGVEARADVHVRAGRAAPEIADFAKERGADLLVIASHGLTGISHMLLGSVTEQLVRRATCPVFTVKAFGRELFQSQANT